MTKVGIVQSFKAAKDVQELESLRKKLDGYANASSDTRNKCSRIAHRKLKQWGMR